MDHHSSSKAKAELKSLAGSPSEMTITKLITPITLKHEHERLASRKTFTFTFRDPNAAANREPQAPPYTY